MSGRPMLRIGLRARLPARDVSHSRVFSRQGPKPGQPRTRAGGKVVAESNLRLRAAARGTTRSDTSSHHPGLAGRRRLPCASAAGLHPETGRHPGS
jgi:hypothetical protein